MLNSSRQIDIWKGDVVGHLLALNGPSPGEPAPPLMHVVTHLTVHDSAFLDLGRWILEGFPSSPAHTMIIPHLCQ